LLGNRSLHVVSPAIGVYAIFEIQLKVAVVRSDKLEAEAGDSFGVHNRGVGTFVYVKEIEPHK
jgi:hypothetical protein